MQESAMDDGAPASIVKSAGRAFEVLELFRRTRRQMPAAEIGQALGPTRELVRAFWLSLGAGALVALVLLFAGAWWITTPLRRLVSAAEGLLIEGEQTAPYKETRYDEAAKLSGVLVRLQSRLFNRSKPSII